MARTTNVCLRAAAGARFGLKRPAPRLGLFGGVTFGVGGCKEQ